MVASASPTPPVAATDAHTPVPSASATASATGGPIVLDVDWTVPFSLTAPADWTTEGVNEESGGKKTANTVWIGAGQRFVAVTRTGPETVQGWLDTLAETEQLVATEPVEVEIGGSSGYRVDLEVSDQASDARCVNNGRCYTLFQDDSGYWPVEEGRTTRVWLVEVEGETLTIATDSRDDAFAEWAETVEAVLGTIEWDS